MVAIFIDAKNRQVSPVTTKGQLEDFYRIMNVEMVEIAEYWENGDTLWVDEEGLINGTNFGFEINGNQYLGNGMIYGTNRENPENNDSAVTKIDSLKIKFFELVQLWKTVTELYGKSMWMRWTQRTRPSRRTIQ
jgi:hypothetical protein